MAALSWKTNDIANDPPRPDWGEPAVPTTRELRLSLLGEYPDGLRFVRCAETLVESEALLAAGLTAVERAQGAEKAGHTGAERERGSEARQWFRLASGVLVRISTDLSELSALVSTAGSDGPEEGIPRTLSAFPSDVRQLAVAVGLGPSDFARLAEAPWQRRQRRYSRRFRERAAPLSHEMTTAAKDADKLARSILHWVNSGRWLG
ncbi:MAG TPA: hypothetical protein VGG41_11920 [Solirubrobacteraceae bacterium]|jgi:hypothetical protein